MKKQKIKKIMMYNKNNELQAFMVDEDYQIILYYEKLAAIWKCDKNDILVKDVEF
jgi:hypothetical protein